MTYHGHVENGHIILDNSVALPEGAAVTVELHDASAAKNESASDAAQARRGLMKFAGIAKDLPPDAARNHDHYLYGYPRQ